MKKEIRTVVYDDELRMEAYRFEGIVQPFPSHFHEHYVIGFVEKGERVLSCRDREYAIEEGCIVLFNPGDSHACVQSDEGTFDYRGFNISKEVMLDLAQEVTGKRELPGFSENVVCDEEIACHLRPLHEMVMKGTGEFGKEETLLFLLSYLIQNYGKPSHCCIPECRQEIEKACEYMTAHFTERIYLDQICRHAGLSKSTLLRAFTKEKGVTPYRYLETIRINEAKRLLSEGVPPVEAAIRTGFSDQSHFTNYFNFFLGLAPGTYREIFSEKNGDGGRGVGTMNEPAIRTEEQIISLFPDRETLICRGWVLKRMEGQLLVYPLYYKFSDGDIPENIRKCEEISRQCGAGCVFRIVEHTNYHLSSILTDNGYGLEKCGVVGECSLTGDAGKLCMKEKVQGGLFLKNGNGGTEYVMAGKAVIGIKRQGLLFLPDGNLPDTGLEDILRFAAANGIVRILADIPGEEELPEQYGRLGFRRAYLYRCYQKNQEEKFSGKGGKILQRQED